MSVRRGVAPAFDQQLVGKYIEVLWKYHDKDTGEPMLIWSTGRVARVADGLTDKRSSRAKKLLPAGMLLWQWDADPEFGEKAGEQWLHLLPQKWNKQLVYSWRFDPRELAAAEGAPTRDERSSAAVMQCALTSSGVARPKKWQVFCVVSHVRELYCL